MEPSCTAHMGAHIWDPYRLLAGYALHSSQTFFMDTCTIPIHSSVDHDQMAFDIQKEINLGSTRLNCNHYF